MNWVAVHDVSLASPNPCYWSEPFQFEVCFECFHDLKEDLEWKITYIGSSIFDDCDQVLERILVGPIITGVSRFLFQATPADASKIPPSELLGLTVVLITCSYKDKEFIRVGYYVNNEYDNEEMRASPPEKPVLGRIARSILQDQPRITHFAIEWD
eukprot:TRINITY_DN4620_c0_g1_i1.p1 TRINITY_DN4620_c0_g1~~TRINITY_DN4620_c0_g1_i1.p1  ORF type:complete len:156 (-),score=21.37 TRINITY_DN4620_c0_g1_i1:166-633(-)